MYMCIVWDKDTIVVVLLLYITTIDCRSNNQHVLEVHRPIAKLDFIMKSTGEFVAKCY